MHQDVAEYVKTCAVCASTKRGALQSAAPLRPYTASEPWDTISVDILGPYPKTAKGYKFVIIAEDVFSKWVEAAPSADGRVRTVLEFLENYVFARWGYPKTIISDNAVVFRSSLWLQTLERNQIAHRYAPIHHQQSNPVERRVQELKKILRTRVNPHHPERWDAPLADALFCLRTRANAATGTTPSELLLGYKLRRPGETVREADVDDPVTRQEQEIRRRRIEKVQRRQATYQRKVYPERRQATTRFQEGDDVLAREPVNPGHPFHHVWTGPWKVTEVLGDNTYEVDKAGKLTIIHVDDLRAAVPDREGPVLVPPGATENAISDSPIDMPGPSQTAVPNESREEPSPEPEHCNHPCNAPAAGVHEEPAQGPLCEPGNEDKPEPASLNSSPRKIKRGSRQLPAALDTPQSRSTPDTVTATPNLRRSQRLAKTRVS